MSIYLDLSKVSFFQNSSGQQFKIGGYRPDPVNESDKKYSTGRYYAQQLPPRVDLRPYMTTVEQQAEIGSCTANAMAGAYEYLAMRQFGWAEDVSRLFIYYNARELDGSVDQDSGAYLSSCITVLRKYGACSEKTWPYHPHKIFHQPHDFAYEEAASFLIDDAERIDIDLYTMRHCLAEGYPFAFGLQLFSSFYEVTKDGRVSMPNPDYEEYQGGHAMLCVGYSDKDGMFLVRNSWGTSWGDQGYCYIPYDYMTNSRFCSDCWVIRSVGDLDFSQDVWCDASSFFDLALIAEQLGLTSEDDFDYEETDYNEVEDEQVNYNEEEDYDEGEDEQVNYNEEEDYDEGEDEEADYDEGDEY